MKKFNIVKRAKREIKDFVELFSEATPAETKVCCEEEKTTQAFISRQEAKELLYKLSDSGILDPEIEEALSEIGGIIGHEEEGLHLWGASIKDLEKIFDSEECCGCKGRSTLISRYSFIPSEEEKKAVLKRTRGR